MAGTFEVLGHCRRGGVREVRIAKNAGARRGQSVRFSVARILRYEDRIGASIEVFLLAVLVAMCAILNAPSCVLRKKLQLMAISGFHNRADCGSVLEGF